MFKTFEVTLKSIDVATNVYAVANMFPGGVRFFEFMLAIVIATTTLMRK